MIPGKEIFRRKLALRVKLDDGDVEALDRVVGSPQQVEAGHPLTLEGASSDHTHILLDGFACRHRQVAESGRSIVAYLVPGDGCDLHASILGRTRHTITTLTPCTVASISYRSIKETAAYRPNIYLALWWSVLIDESILQEWLIGVGRRPPDKLIAHFLCEIVARLQAIGLASEPGFRLPISQAELADTAGLSHVHVHRVFADLRKAGLVESKRKGVIIPDFDRLRNFAGFDPGYLHLPPSPAALEPPNALAEATRREFESRFG